MKHPGRHQIDISRYIVHDVGSQALEWRAEERKQRAQVKKNADELQGNVPWNSPRPRHLFIHQPLFPELEEDLAGASKASASDDAPRASPRGGNAKHSAVDMLRKELRTPAALTRQLTERKIEAVDPRSPLECLAVALSGARLSDAFSAFDRDGSGYLDRGEFVGALGRLGVQPDLASALFNELDDTGDGTLSFKEVVEEIRRKAAELAKEEAKRLLHDKELNEKMRQERQQTFLERRRSLNKQALLPMAANHERAKARAPFATIPHNMNHASRF
jgi:FAD/FMN-containing dehydrogenase